MVMQLIEKGDTSKIKNRKKNRLSENHEQINYILQDSLGKRRRRAVCRGKEGNYYSTK